MIISNSTLLSTIINNLSNCYFKAIFKEKNFLKSIFLLLKYIIYLKNFVTIINKIFWEKSGKFKFRVFKTNYNTLCGR